MSAPDSGLARDGYFIRDRFAGAEAEAALQVVTKLPLRAARVGHEQLDGVRGDAIAWVVDAAINTRLESLRDEINRSHWLGLGRFEVQVARYLPGARYPRHRDAFRGARSRRLTAIWYLNREPLGGDLRLHVDPPLDITPAFDRLVVFLSEEIEHEVLPTGSERWAITAWYY
jgi:SM-20-related protein